MVDGMEIAELKLEQRYKYLGIQQTYEIRQKENKEDTKNELMKRVRKILKTQLSARNIIEALNTWAILIHSWSTHLDQDRAPTNRQTYSNNTDRVWYAPP